MDLDLDYPSILGEETQPRTLYVGNLDLQMSEEFLHVLFSQIGPIKGCKIIHEGFLVIAVIAVDFVSCVLWVRPLVKVRLRPPRHPIAQASNHHPYHRAHTFVKRPPIMPPHHDMPVFSYRPPGSVGPGFTMKQKHVQPIPHSSNNHNRFRGPPAHHHFIQDEIFPDTQHKLIKFESPSSNLLENSGYTLSTLDDGQQHGYLSPKYKGWKPISKPYFHTTTSQESKGDRHTYPTTETYQDLNGRHHKLMLTTLFRDNVKNIKPPGHVKLKEEYSENRGVAIPLPTELGGSSITLPASIFLERPQQSNYNFYAPAVSPSQSEAKPVIRKPFPRFQNKIKPEEKANQSFSTALKENGEGTELPNLLTRFKNIRPKLRIPPPQSNYDNEPEIDGIGPTNLPKPISPFPTKAPEVSTQSPVTLKDKFGKVRTRIRTRIRPPEAPQGQGQVNTEDLRQVFSQQPRPLETSINPKEAFRDPERQQQHNSLPYVPTAFTKNTSLSPGPYKPKENHVSNYPDRTPSEYAWNKNRPSSNQVEQSPEVSVSGNKISDGSNVREVGSNSGSKDKTGAREIKRKPNSQGKYTEPTTPVVYSESPVYAEEFYMPPGFLQNPSLSGHNPVSFMTMPNSQPQVIHHSHNGHPPQNPHQLYPINVIGSGERHKSKHYHQPNDGTSPNSNYAQNNRPHFPFMNIQDGQLQQPEGPNPISSQETPFFIPQTYDTGVTSQPFSHSTPFSSTGSGYHYHGTGSSNSPEQSPSLRYHNHRTPTMGLPSSTTPRNPYAYQTDSRYPSHYINHPSHHIDETLKPHHHPKRIHQLGNPNRNPPTTQPYSHHLNNNQEVYSSSEYKQIPMEFMNHLRPILLEEESPLQSNSIPSPSSQNEFYSSEMYPPNDYFDNFFKSFENNREESSTPLNGKRYVAESSADAGVRIPYDSYRSSSNPQVKVIEPNSGSPNKTFGNALTPRWSPPKHPIVSISPIHEYTFESTVSPIQDIEIFRRKPQMPRNWSKLKEGGSGFSTEINTQTSNYKIRSGDQQAQESEKRQSEIGNTTVKPVVSSSFSSVRKPEESSVSKKEVEEYIKPIPFVVTRSSGEESSTARSYRTRGTTESVAVTKPESESSTQPQQDEGTRPLRRRKVGMIGHRFFTSPRVNEVEDDKLSDPPVTTHRPRRLILSTSTGATMEKPDDSSESFEISRAKRLKARRRFFNRRINVHANRAGMIGLRATTPPASDTSDAVTYGESQWFKIKDLVPEVTESGIGGGVEMGKTSAEKLSSSGGSMPETRFSSRTLSMSTTPNAQLEALEMSSESLIESESSSGKKFYEGEENVAVNVAPGVEDGGKRDDRDEEKSGTQTEPMS